MRNRRVLPFLGVAATLILAAGAACSAAPIHRVGKLDTGTAYDVDVQGDQAFVTGNDGLVVIDIREPSRPKRLPPLIWEKPP